TASLRAANPSPRPKNRSFWRCGRPPAPITRRAVARQLAGRGWASGTVLTFLTRLEAKGWLTAAKESNHNVYTPAVTRRAYGVAVMRHRLDTLFGGDLAAAVRALVSECGATPGQLAQAAAVIEAKRAEAEEYDSYDVFF